MRSTQPSVTPTPSAVSLHILQTSKKSFSELPQLFTVFCSYSLKKYPSGTVCYPKILGCMVIYWVVVDFPGAILWEKKPSLSQHLTTAYTSMARGGILGPISLSVLGVWFGLGLHSLVGAGVHKYNCPIVQRRHCFLVVSYHFCNDPWALEGGVWYIYILGMSILQSLEFDQLWISGLITIYQK